jgi:hypothetical protein
MSPGPPDGAVVVVVVGPARGPDVGVTAVVGGGGAVVTVAARRVGLGAAAAGGVVAAVVGAVGVEVDVDVVVWEVGCAEAGVGGAENRAAEAVTCRAIDGAFGVAPATTASPALAAIIASNRPSRRRRLADVRVRWPPRMDGPRRPGGAR